MKEIEQKLQYEITELVLCLTDGYCDLSKYSFDDDQFARFQFFIQDLITQTQQQKTQEIVEMIERMRKPIDYGKWGGGNEFSMKYNNALDDLLTNLKDK